jgi:hypothetical protein
LALADAGQEGIWRVGEGAAEPAVREEQAAERGARGEAREEGGKDVLRRRVGCCTVGVAA